MINISVHFLAHRYNIGFLVSHQILFLVYVRREIVLVVSLYVKAFRAEL